jgi:death on curing protein
MSEFYFFERTEVILIHQMLIDAFGGMHGIRDFGLLDSALAQPRITFEGAFLHSNVPEMASAYFFHIIKNHPFIDGNKRTGSVVAIAFAHLNGFESMVSNADLYDLAVDVAKSTRSKQSVIAIFAQTLALRS